MTATGRPEPDGHAGPASAPDPLRLHGDGRVSLVLIRHGESTWVAEGRFQGRGDPPLSTLGQRQAQAVAGRLADRADGDPLGLGGSPVGVWHSPLQRAADTAAHIRDGLVTSGGGRDGESGRGDRAAPPPLHSDEGLSEIDQGQWQGLTHAEVRARWAGTLDAWRRDPTSAQAPDGEPLREADARVRRSLDDILRATMAARSRGAHGAAEPSRSEVAPWAVVVAHDGVLRLALMALLGMPLARFWSLPFVLCGISLVDVSLGGSSLRAHNLVDHLSGVRDHEVADTGPLRGPLIDRGGAL